MWSTTTTYYNVKYVKWVKNINLVKKSTKYKHIYQEIKPGDYYFDCAYHPMLCTENDGYTLIGISLIDGMEHGCSVYYCGAKKITFEKAIERKNNWEKFIESIYKNGIIKL